MQHKQLLVVAAAAALWSACVEPPLGPNDPAPAAQFASVPAYTDGAILATLRSATARYHDVNVAIEDGFFLRLPCEIRPGEGPAGALYVNRDRIFDGVIDPELPEGLLYDVGDDGALRLAGVDFVMPKALWTEPSPPTFLGETFWSEDEFNVWALHVWIWLPNPEGMFEESNPRLSCGS